MANIFMERPLEVGFKLSICWSKPNHQSLLYIPRIKVLKNLITIKAKICLAVILVVVI